MELVYAQVFRTGRGFALARGRDDRVYFAHVRDARGFNVGVPGVGTWIAGTPLQTEKGLRLRYWYEPLPDELYPPTDEERELESRILALRRRQHQLEWWKRYCSPWQAYRCLRGKGGPMPLCPQCGEKLNPQITADPIWGIKVHLWEFSCSCGWQERVETEYWTEHRRYDADDDQPWRYDYVTEETEEPTTESAVVWLDQDEPERKRIEEELRPLLAQSVELRQKRLGGAK